MTVAALLKKPNEEFAYFLLLPARARKILQTHHHNHGESATSETIQVRMFIRLRR